MFKLSLSWKKAFNSIVLYDKTRKKENSDLNLKKLYVNDYPTQNVSSIVIALFHIIFLGEFRMQEQTNLFVNLRCCEFVNFNNNFNNNVNSNIKMQFEVNIYVGCGITKDSQAEKLNNFLKHNSCDTLYLVGDIIDGWALKNGGKWKKDCTKIFRKFMKRSEKGTEVIYIRGNHDDFLKPFIPFTLNNIRISNLHS